MWEVTRYVDASPVEQFTDGELAVALRFGSVDLAQLEWSRATRDGIPAHADRVIGDADLSLLLGDSPFAAGYPMVFGQSRPATPEEEEAHRRHEGVQQGLGRLLPTSSVDALVLRPSVQFPWWLKNASSPVWVGRSSDGDVLALVVDFLTGLVEADEAQLVESPWDQDMAGAVGGHMSTDAATSPDSSNLTRLPTLPHIEEVRMWHQCHMQGQLFIVDTQPDWAVKIDDVRLDKGRVNLGISVDGPAQFYALRSQEEMMTLLRLADEPPSHWMRLSVSDGRGTILTSEALVGSGEPLVRAAFAEVSDRNATALIEQFPAVALWPTIDGGRPTVWMVGMTEDGRVAALLVADDPEKSVYACRPPEEDLPALLAIRGVRVPDADREEFDDAIGLLESMMQGRVTAPDPETRGLLHWMFNRYVLND